MSKRGVLVCQVGTPVEPSVRAVKSYLKEFLSDPFVVPADRWWWKVLLHAVILPLRSPKVAKKYQQIWRAQGSPLRVYTEALSSALAERLAGKMPVASGMRYGQPSIERAVQDLAAQGCREIVLFSLYPQHGAATLGTFTEAAQRAIALCRDPIALVIAPSYHTHPAWLQAEASFINQSLASAQQRPELLLLSYHGIPKASVDLGEQYPRYCRETTAALTPLLEIEPERIRHCYQSRFGPAEWTRPYTEEVLVETAKQGVRRLAVACPGFPCDCLETLYDVGIAFRDLFCRAGGEFLLAIPGLNDRSSWVTALAEDPQFFGAEK